MAPQNYSGPWQNFPSIDNWIGFEDMFNRNKPSMFATGDTGEDVGRIWNAIKECAKIGVDERVILAIIMQESHGDVGVQTTYSPGDNIPTGGLMQCGGCAGCPGQHGVSQEAITDMVRKGTEHFKGNLTAHGDKWSGESIYPALREYNSGNVNLGDLSDGRGATASYVSDIANRLTGWVN
ncbi:hypothetical protein DPSP01_005146 [Paraphaeosphaeria sporulosa]|uniref:Transglycosylase SLT domain-containing protein n=1 Tax=Paraphaeosphaeria sporulosa TaxID=1460663 RepID=A0A177BYG3_9PLEO|nr:uncharacterized protein CC84DRAFT_1181197 [Paraphaeosphaeria sporulosa]OAF99728.1 hypothetical protein CC84DRAFT_1181197 [Paraphaeosphaeria sporulosa]